jgi:hypothetical protein
MKKSAPLPDLSISGNPSLFQTEKSELAQHFACDVFPNNASIKLYGKTLDYNL